MGEREIFSRKDFLACTGLSISAVYANLFFGNDIEKIFTPRSSEQEYRKAESVIIYGENEVFRYNNMNVRAMVNPDAFTESLKKIADERGGTEKVNNFLSNNSIRVSLYEDLPKGTRARFDPAGKDVEYTIMLPTRYLSGYLDAILSGREGRIKYEDKTICHELTHLWQFLMMDRTLIVDTLLENGIDLFLIYSGAKAGYNIDRMREEKAGNPKDVSTLMYALSGGLLGLVSSEMLGDRIQLDLIEDQADAWEGEIIEYDSLKMYRGKYFHFKKS